MFRCCSLETSHPRLLPQSPKDCSIHLCLFLFCCHILLEKHWICNCLHHFTKSFNDKTIVKCSKWFFLHTHKQWFLIYYLPYKFLNGHFKIVEHEYFILLIKFYTMGNDRIKLKHPWFTIRDTCLWILVHCLVVWPWENNNSDSHLSQLWKRDHSRYLIG